MGDFEKWGRDAENSSDRLALSAVALRWQEVGERPKKHLTDAGHRPRVAEERCAQAGGYRGMEGVTALVSKGEGTGRVLAYLRTDPVATFSHAPRRRFGIHEGQPNLRTSHHQQT